VCGPGYIQLGDGEEIGFGKGPESSQLQVGLGPHPLLCNLKLAVSRILKMSGAGELIARLVDDADDSHLHHIYLASKEFCDILTAKLLVSGHALILD
jgi:hypothetical protein